MGGGGRRSTEDQGLGPVTANASRTGDGRGCSEHGLVGGRHGDGHALIGDPGGRVGPRGDGRHVRNGPWWGPETLWRWRIRGACRRGDGVHLDHPALDGRVGHEGHAGARRQVVAVGSGERKGGVRESAGERIETIALCGHAGKVVRMQPDPVARRDGRAASLRDPGTFHRALDAAFELDRLGVGPEQPSRRALEDSLEEPFEIGKDRHRSRNRTRAGRIGHATGPTPHGARYHGLGPRWTGTLYSWPCPAGAGILSCPPGAP